MNSKHPIRMGTLTWLKVQVTCLSFLVASVAAQANDYGYYSPFPVEVILWDSPYLSDAPAPPSMQQALKLSKSAYQAAHYGLGHGLDPFEDDVEGFLNVLGFGFADLILSYLPPFDSWLHEEFHRSVMGVYGVASRNRVYDLKIGSATISVTHERDEDLANLKRQHPAAFVRLAAAGIEGESLLVQGLERDAFFSGVRNYHDLAMLMIKINSYAYIASGPTEESEKLTDDANQREDQIEERDFVGHDFTSWVYDLHRPDEPYEARGTHPSGNGINRYRKDSDLKDGERRYLELQGRLHLLNLLDPAMIGHGGFEIAPATYFQGNFEHLLGPFGYEVSFNALTKSATDLKIATKWTLYRNQKLNLPGLGIELVRFPIKQVASQKLSAFTPNQISVRSQIWKQPKNLRYDDDESALGGLLGASLYWQLPLVRMPTNVFLESDVKSPGWVLGHPYLEQNFSTRLGLETWIL